MLDRDYTLKKITERVVDDIYGTTEVSETEYEIKGMIIPLTTEDLRYELGGKYEAGDARGYFLQEYIIGTEIITVKNNDILVDGEKNYRVDIYNDYKWKNIEVREVYMRRIKDA